MVATEMVCYGEVAASWQMEMPISACAHGALLRQLAVHDALMPLRAQEMWGYSVDFGLLWAGSLA